MEFTWLIRAGFVVLLVLVLALSTRQRAQGDPRRLAVQEFALALLFVGLGVAARVPAVNILGPRALETLAPLAHAGLGWLGFVIGLRLDVRAFENYAPSTPLSPAAIFIRTLAAASAGLAVLSAAGGMTSPGPLARSALVVALAAMVVGARPGWRIDAYDDGMAAQALQQAAAVLGVLVLAAFFRPGWARDAWPFPGTVWIFLALGIGAAVGLLAYAVLRLRARANEFLAISLGVVAFTAGLAAHLGLPSIAVCLVAGGLLANLPWSDRPRFSAVLVPVERPLHFLFLLIAGAYFPIRSGTAWLLAGALIVARAAGVRVARGFTPRRASTTPPEESGLLASLATPPPVIINMGPAATTAAANSADRPVLQPVGATALAIVLSAQALWHDTTVLIMGLVVAGLSIDAVRCANMMFGPRTRTPANPVPTHDRGSPVEGLP